MGAGKKTVLTAYTGSAMLGNLALSLGYLSPDKLRDALDAQARGGGKLGEILVRRGHLTPEQLERLLDVQSATERRRDDAYLGRIGVLNGFYSEAQLKACLAEQAQDPSRRIGEILWCRGLVDRAKLDAMLATQQRLAAERGTALPAVGAQTFDFPSGDVITIGRAEDCAIRLGDREASRHHARIVRKDGGAYVEDLQSLTGVIVDGVIVEGPTALRDGSVIVIGSTALVYRALRAAPPRVVVRPHRPTPAVPAWAVAASVAVVALGLLYMLSPGPKPPKPAPVATVSTPDVAPPVVAPAPPPPRKPIANNEAQAAAMNELEEIPSAVEEAPVVAKAPDPIPEPTPAPAPVVAPTPTPAVDPKPVVTKPVADPKAALAARRDKAVQTLRAMGLERKWAVVTNLRLQLFELRLAAILQIADAKRYSHETGQQEVDKRVAAVREFVKKYAGRGIGKLPPSGRKALEEIDACERELGAPVVDADVEVARRIADGPVTVDAYALPWERQDMAAYNAAVLKSNLALKAKVPPSAWELVKVLNDYRILMGRHALRIDLALMKAAQVHSDWMARSGKLDHFEDIPAQRSPADRARAAGFPGGAIGENIQVGVSTSRDAHDGWYHSAPHHRNMLQLSHADIGVGESNAYWTELFGRAP